MGLLDLFRPKWKHSRLDVRLEAVRQLGEDEVTTLTEVARRDPEAQVRELAFKRLSDPEVLLGLVDTESDSDLRALAGRRASELSLRRAIDSKEDRDSVAAVERITEARMLVEVIRKAASSAARHRALLRLDDPRSLAEVAQKADDPQMRAEAVAKITEPKVLRDLAIKEATKAVQLLAIDRLSDASALRTVVEKGKSKALRQAAKDKLAQLGISAEAPVVPREKKAKKPLDPASEARLKARKIEAEMRKRAEESRKSAAGDKKARLEAEHAERLRRLEAEEAEAKLSPEARAAKAASQPVVQAPRAERPRRDEDPEQAAKTAAREAERASRDAEKAQKNAERAVLAKENAAQLESLVERLEALAGTTDFKAAGDALKEARERGRSVLPDGSEALRERFEKARTVLGAKLNELREAEDWKRFANVPKLEALCARAEALAQLVIGALPLPDGEELDPRKVSRELKALQTEWKELGRAPKDKADQLWERFKAACDITYEGNKKGLDLIDEERSENLKMKAELCDRVEALVASPEATENPKLVSEQIKQMQEDWKKIGPVPKSENDKVWERFRGACDKFFAARKEAFGKQDEVRGATLEKQLALVGKAEALKTSVDFKGTADKIKALQDEWKQLGPGKKGDSDEAWKRFRAACDFFFERRKAHFEEMDGERDANLVKKEALVAQAEQLAAGDDVLDPDAKIRELMGEWKKVGPVAKEKGDEIWARFGKALDALRNPAPASPEVMAEASGVGFENKFFGSLGEKLQGVVGEKAEKPVAATSPSPSPSPSPSTPTSSSASTAPSAVSRQPSPSAVSVSPSPSPAPIEEPPSKAPVEDPSRTPTPSPVKEPTPAPAPEKEPTPAPAPEKEPPAPAPPVKEPTPVTPPAPVEEPAPALAPTPQPAPIEVPEVQQPTPAPAPIEVPSSTPAPMQTPTVAKSTTAPEMDAWPAPEAWTLPDEPGKS